MSQTASEQAASAPATGGWRTRVGTAMLVLGLVILPVVALSLPLFGVTGAPLAAIGGGIAVTAEVMMVAGAALAGKEGFARIKAKLLGFLKPLAPPDTVGPVRYRIGLVLFVLPLLFAWASFYFSDYIPAIEENLLHYGIAGDIMLAVSLFVLGGDFWDKLRSLFIHDATAVFLAEASTSK